MTKQHFFILLSILLFSLLGIAQSTDTFTDLRDGQTYKTFSVKNAKLGTVVWMAENLNYKVEGSYAYDGNESNRNEFGLLYTWEAAKEACPNGWHLPTDNEWSMLVSAFGGTDKAGEALKSINGWNEEGNGTNSSGFNALPGGIRRNNGYDVMGYLGYWWSSTPTGEEGKAWEWNMHYGDLDPTSGRTLKSKVFRFDADMLGGLSVRYVQD